MNYVFTGTPGSGKSLRAMQTIEKYLEQGKNVISNFPIHIDQIKRNKGHYFYLPNEKITVEYLTQFSKIKHELEMENQTLIVFDEASVKFNSRDFTAKDRMSFLNFFSQHRKYGYNILMITQSIRQIDRQVRDQFEIEIKHRKLNNYKFFWILPFPLFISVSMHIAFNDKIESEFFLYRKRYGNMYDTFFEFDKRIVADESKKEEFEKLIQNTEIEKQDVHKRKSFYIKNLITAKLFDLIEKEEGEENEKTIFSDYDNINHLFKDSHKLNNDNIIEEYPEDKRDENEVIYTRVFDTIIPKKRPLFERI